MKISLLSVAATVLLLAAGCQADRTWDPSNPPSAEVGPSGLTKRIVLFAPVDATPLIEDYPDAGSDFARDLARRVDVFVENAEAWVGETLPVSTSPAWDRGPVGGAAGAHNVVLTSISRIDLPVGSGTPANPAKVRAHVLIRVLDADGNELWANEFTGHALDESSPKLMSDAAKPVSRAAWDACDTASWALRRWLEAQGAPGGTRPDTTAPPVDEATLIDVTIDSLPTNADIFVDGIFRGNTPTVVPLPVRDLTVRIERAGYLPWERVLTPSPEMRIQPALEPVGGVPAAQPAGTLPLPGERLEAEGDDGAVVEPKKDVRPTTDQMEEPATAEPEPEPIEEPSAEAEPAPVEEAPIDDLETVELPEVE